MDRGFMMNAHGECMVIQSLEEFHENKRYILSVAGNHILEKSVSGSRFMSLPEEIRGKVTSAFIAFVDDRGNPTKTVDVAHG